MSGPGSCSCAYVAFVACALNAHPCARVCTWLDKLVGHTNVPCTHRASSMLSSSGRGELRVTRNEASTEATLILTGCKVHFAVVVHSIWHCSYLLSHCPHCRRMLNGLYAYQIVKWEKLQKLLHVFANFPLNTLVRSNREANIVTTVISTSLLYRLERQRKFVASTIC